MFIISIPIAAYDGDKLVGVTTAFDYGKLGMIGNVLVSEDYRGKNIGSKLVKEAMKRNNFIGSLTSTSFRINDVHKTIETLKKQTTKLDILYLNLSKSKFTTQPSFCFLKVNVS